jgi:hypothetical protein
MQKKYFQSKSLRLFGKKSDPIMECNNNTFLYDKSGMIE